MLIGLVVGERAIVDPNAAVDRRNGPVSSGDNPRTSSRADLDSLALPGNTLSGLEGNLVQAFFWFRFLVVLGIVQQN